MSDADACGVGQILRVHQRFAAKTGKHQAHQLRARRFDGQTRREAGGRSQIIDSASFSISLKQFLNCITRRSSHRPNMRPLEWKKRESLKVRKQQVWSSAFRRYR